METADRPLPAFPYLCQMPIPHPPTPAWGPAWAEVSLEVVQAGEAPFRDSGTTSQRELLQRVGQRVEAAETPVIHVGTALQPQGLELLQGHCKEGGEVRPLRSSLEPATKGRMHGPARLHPSHRRCPGLGS